ncbi:MULTISPECIES: hydantoinase/oxoprolinase family protein [unclassified Thioalkalivibrio]|uniref:hydantoinase/oxoprolinase family protein n=1 Tax=unclassified Thioalkalivibrio TaxID=2621013 RepID=UPI0003822CD3|nr:MULTISPECIES: hydantoinase/oxoprolinase family protein [unclassified Thioalkalivibrio]
MPSEVRYVGWDIGGAHLKVAMLDANGRLCAARTLSTPLWKGTDALVESFHEARTTYGLQGVRHAVTMTGELADIFTDRAEGVRTLLNLFSDCFPQHSVGVYGGALGFMEPGSAIQAFESVASANWHATATLAARCYPRGLLVDVGSTTTDLVWIQDGRVYACGTNDHTRLALGELIYSGVVRTPVMKMATAVPFRGVWVDLVAEHFATAADVYRLSGDLPEDSDLGMTADGRDKTLAKSEARLARMLGTDASNGSSAMWKAIADYLAECQVHRLTCACQLQISRGISADTPLLGAGIGRFLVERVARRLGMDYDVCDPLDDLRKADFKTSLAADMGPAVAVAYLMREEA